MWCGLTPDRLGANGKPHGGMAGRPGNPWPVGMIRPILRATVIQSKGLGITKHDRTPSTIQKSETARGSSVGLTSYGAGHNPGRLSVWSEVQCW